MTKKLNIPFSPPDITEEEIQAVAEVMRSGWITTGPKTKQFEKEIAAYCHTQKAVCMNSATACLEMTLRLFGIGEGDEVIVPAYLSARWGQRLSWLTARRAVSIWIMMR